MSKKILIIDDDPAIVEFLEELFQDNEYTTVTAFNGVDGLEKVKAETPDLITLDMDMPEKGGTLFYAGLRKEEALRNTPVIVISGVGPRPPAISKEIPVLTKPVDHDELLKLAASILG